LPEEKTGVLLVNLGTPAAPTARAIGRYLRQFLSDPRVVEAPRLLWWLALNLFIIPIRSRKISKNYRSIWREAGSPLKVISDQQVLALQRELDEAGGAFSVASAMTYGQTSIAKGVELFVDQGLKKIIILPLFPQYSGTTTAAVYDQVAALVKRYRHIPDMRIVHHYFDNPAYIDALAESVREHWQKNGVPQRLLMSFHGIPERYVEKGDPYYQQCKKTAELLAKRLGLSDEGWFCSFQSRVGKLEWVKPYTDVVLREWGGEGLSSVAVICPAFSVDCLETLEEIDCENRQVFNDAGGGEFSLVPCLNASEAHIKLFAHLLSER